MQLQLFSLEISIEREVRKSLKKRKVVITLCHFAALLAGFRRTLKTNNGCKAL
jgi:hypothetical protein